MLKYEKRRVVDVWDWDKLVEETYGKPYNFQQQEGCQERGTHELSIPDSEAYDFENETLPYEINGNEMGIKFQVWLDTPAETYRDIFWQRNFYPDIQTLANDLYKRGLIEAGDYTIDIDW